MMEILNERLVGKLVVLNPKKKSNHIILRNHGDTFKVIEIRDGAFLCKSLDKTDRGTFYYRWVHFPHDSKFSFNIINED